jgi:hypothetical protein
METCGTCKYRGQQIEGDWDDEAMAPKLTDYFACELIKHDAEYQYLPKAGAVVTDGSGCMAKLCVEEDFGCNRWEAKT